MGPSEERRLLKAMREFGLVVETRTRGHRLVLYRNQPIASLPGHGGGSDWRNWANALRDIRNGCGFEWRPKQPRKSNQLTA